MAETAAHIEHPSTKQYVQIAIFLAVLTAIEVALFYVNEALDMRGWDAPLLIVLSLIKFIVVIGWFMHLRFENTFLARFFSVGFVAAMTLYGIVLLSFGAIAIFG